MNLESGALELAVPSGSGFNIDMEEGPYNSFAFPVCESVDGTFDYCSAIWVNPHRSLLFVVIGALATPPTSARGLSIVCASRVEGGMADALQRMLDGLAEMK